MIPPTDFLSDTYSDIISGILSNTYSDMSSGNFLAYYIYTRVYIYIRIYIYTYNNINMQCIYINIYIHIHTYSDIPSGILFGILFDIVSGILSGILSDILRSRCPPGPRSGRDAIWRRTNGPMITSRDPHLAGG